MDEIKITIIGVGGASLSILNYMKEKGLTGVNFVAVNTDKEGLEHSTANMKVLIGEGITGGMGTYGKIQLGKEAANESGSLIKDSISGSHVALIVSGLGGGTGSGASPVVAEICKEAGIPLIIPIVCMPFSFEGKERTSQAEKGLGELQTVLDSVVIITCDHLRDSAWKTATMAELFRQIDLCVYQVSKELVGLLLSRDTSCFDFLNMKSIFSTKGKAFWGSGSGSGQNKGVEAIENVLNHPLLLKNKPLSQAQNIYMVINVRDSDISLNELIKLHDIFCRKTDIKCKFILSEIIDKTLRDQIKISIFALGYIS